MIYLDNAATTAVCPEAAEKAKEAMLCSFGNPGSTHKAGRQAKALLDESRKTLAGIVACTPAELFFTSCGTESDNWAIISGAAKNRGVGNHIISSEAEHPGVLEPLGYLKAQGKEVSLLKPERDGSISPEAVLEALRPDTCLISLMLVNNETGAVTDIASIAREVKKRNPRTLIHTDAVQGFMKLPFSASKLGADMISLCGHKIHAPKGVGALYIRKGLTLPPYIRGGGQEGGNRSGTENVPLIAAFAEAARIYKAEMPACLERMAELRSYCISRLSSEIEDFRVLGEGVPNLLSISLPGYRSEVLMNYLEAEEIYVSKSSACKKGGRSHVLTAMGLDARTIDGAIRVSFSRFTDREDAEKFCSCLIKAAGSLKKA